jgi:two-component system sensor histidine kinase KdpD
VIRRRPQTALVDELAHTNVKGSRNAKRYEDVEEILEAGISVISTVNIQHIESLNDIVSRITGIQVHERMPDWVLDAADEVVLVDISVEELQERLQQGKIYSREKIEQALSNFFKKGNLVALRELSLRELANTVEEKAEEDVLACPLEPTGIHERILVCISSNPDSQRLIRRGFRIADRMCGELIVLHVQLKGQKPSSEARQNLEKHRRLTEELEGKFLEVESSSVVDAVVETAKQKRVTQIVVGESLPEGNFFKRLLPALPYQIFKRTDNVDVYLIASGSGSPPRCVVE